MRWRLPGLHNSESSKGQSDQHKFSTDCNSLSCSIVILKKLWKDNYTRRWTFAIFCNWESSHGPQEKLSQAACCVGLVYTMLNMKPNKMSESITAFQRIIISQWMYYQSINWLKAQTS